MSNLTDFFNQVLKSIDTIKEMFKYREVSIEHLDKVSNTEIEKMLYNSLFYIKLNDNYKVIYMLSKANYKNLSNYLSEDFCKNILVVIDNNMKDKTIAKEISSYNKEQENEDTKVHHQIFKLNELQYNIAQHILCPKHILINNVDEIIKIIKELNIESKSKLPRILLTDPMAKYINAKSGNLIKIINVNKSCGEHITYKYC